MNCTLITDHCLACGTGEGYWKGRDGSSHAKFPQYDASYNSYQKAGPCGCGGIGGINNSKNFRTSASSFTLLKKSLTNVWSAPPKSGPSNLNYADWDGESTSNTGGPGDYVTSIPIITNMATSGVKARLNVKATQTGVDVKHNSYERYLARKRGWNMRCQHCPINLDL